MSPTFRSTKDKESEGIKWLQKRIKEMLPKASFHQTANKGRDTKRNDIADAILTYEGKQFPMEIKVIGKSIPTNIRFTHQTMTKALGKDLIVALIYNFDNSEKTGVKFFRFWSLAKANCILIEPHFIVQKQFLNQLQALQDIENLSDMLDNVPAFPSLTSLHCNNKNNHWKLSIEWDAKWTDPA